jgi:hypothetical protein
MYRKFGTVIMTTVFLAVVSLTAWSYAEEGKSAAQVKVAIKEMKEEAAKLGAPKLDGSSLIFGTTKMNGNYTLVDALKGKHACTATFFAKKGDGFVRVSTNVIKDDGSRAVGTPLDPKGPAFAAISKGEAYYGVVDILGKKYEAGYEPIKNEAGEIIGIYYIGFKLD